MFGVHFDAWENVNPDICVNLETTSLHAVIEEKFDYILMLDFIEHLEKAAGQRLIEECKQLVTKKIFLLTPLEEIWTSNEENVNNETYWCHGNKFDLHKSIWSAEEFKEWNTVSLDTLENYYFGYFSK